MEAKLDLGGWRISGHRAGSLSAAARGNSAIQDRIWRFGRRLFGLYAAAVRVGLSAIRRRPHRSRAGRLWWRSNWWPLAWKVTSNRIDRHDPIRIPYAGRHPSIVA